MLGNIKKGPLFLKLLLFTTLSNHEYFFTLYVISRNVFVNVDGEKAKLVIRESIDGEISRSSDCYIIVYAVNDYESFGKYFS